MVKLDLDHLELGDVTVSETTQIQHDEQEKDILAACCACSCACPSCSSCISPDFFS